jgi:hypothetical protein
LKYWRRDAWRSALDGSKYTVDRQTDIMNSDNS